MIDFNQERLHIGELDYWLDEGQWFSNECSDEGCLAAPALQEVLFILLEQMDLSEKLAFALELRSRRSPYVDYYQQVRNDIVITKDTK